jgi:iron complex outermembrane receptor protein
MGGAAGLNYLLQDVGPATSARPTSTTATAHWPACAAPCSATGTSRPRWRWRAATRPLYQTTNINTKGFERRSARTTTDPVTGRIYIADNPAYKFGEISEANAALLREAFPTFDIQSWTRLITWDAKIEGTLFKPGEREVRAAVGTSLMRESFDTPGNPTPPTA